MRGGPVVDAQGNIYVGGEDRRLYCLGPDGTVKWSYQSDYPFYPTPAIGPDGTIFGCSDMVQAITPGGQLKWQYARRDFGMVITTPAKITADGTLLIVVAGSAIGKAYRLIALDTATGAARWEMPFSRGSLCVPAIGHDGTIYVGSEEVTVYAVNAADGSVKWRYTDSDGNWIRGPVVVGDGGDIYYCKSSQNPLANDLICSRPMAHSNGAIARQANIWPIRRRSPLPATDPSTSASTGCTPSRRPAA
jgi:outer membrane protein assembly factor BamB